MKTNRLPTRTVVGVCEYLLVCLCTISHLITCTILHLSITATRRDQGIPAPVYAIAIISVLSSMYTFFYTVYPTLPDNSGSGSGLGKVKKLLRCLKCRHIIITQAMSQLFFETLI